MPILFISLNTTFINEIAKHCYKGYVMNILNYIPHGERTTYYVSAANSMCTMNGGIDYILSRHVFKNAKSQLALIIKQYGKINASQQKYLPIGSSIIINHDDINKTNVRLISAPTMLRPQNVAHTRNAYYATMAILYNILINRGESLHDVDILFTSLCCGCGKMDEHESIKQILEGIRDYTTYKPTIINDSVIINDY